MYDDPNCFRGYEAAGKMIHDALGFYLPVISTEGGPVVGWGDDLRYNKLVPDQQMAMQLEIVRRMQNNQVPEWYFAMCTWLIAARALGDWNPTWEQMGWYTHAWDERFGLNGQLPVIDALKALPSVNRLAPSGTGVLHGQLRRPDGASVGTVRLMLAMIRRCRCSRQQYRPGRRRNQSPGRGAGRDGERVRRAGPGVEPRRHAQGGRQG